jgi:hypothetical protein
VCWSPQHRSLLIVVSASSTPLFEPLHRQWNVGHQRGFVADQADGSHKGSSPGCEVDVQEVRTTILEFFPGLLGLCWVWHCHDKAVPLLPVGMDILCKLDPETSTELHSKMQNSHFYHASESGLIVLPENRITQ